MAHRQLCVLRRLDASIVQLAMPSLETAFDAPINAVSWIAVAYMLAVACALPIFARLAEIAGRKSFFLSGFASFAILSMLCGFAPTPGSMVGLRVLLGIGAAMTGANSVVILVTAVGPERRGKALGIMAATQAVGFAMGPTVGGLLLGTLGWRRVFWVNVPLSLLAFVLSWLIVPKTAMRCFSECSSQCPTLLCAAIASSQWLLGCASPSFRSRLGSSRPLRDQFRSVIPGWC
jgi:MFS family permease